MFCLARDVTLRTRGRKAHDEPKKLKPETYNDVYQHTVVFGVRATSTWRWRRGRRCCSAGAFLISSVGCFFLWSDLRLLHFRTVLFMFQGVPETVHMCRRMWLEAEQILARSLLIFAQDDEVRCTFSIPVSCRFPHLRPLARQMGAVASGT